MMFKSFVIVAAIRSCGAFVAPRSVVSVGVTSSHLMPSALPTFQRGVSLRAEAVLTRPAATTAMPATTSSALQPLVVCGPSGVGKGTIISKFMEGKCATKFGFSVSHTTRDPRPGEVDGVHYHFITREDMLEEIRKGSFLEHAEVHGNIYGTSFQSIFDVTHSGDKQCLLDIDVAGVRSIKDFQSKQQQQESDRMGSTQQYLTSIDSSDDALPKLDAKFIFIAPPSIDVLKDRLLGRGTETPETLERRFNNAKAELEYGMEPGNFDAVVVNDDLTKACAEFEKIVENMYIC